MAYEIPQQLEYKEKIMFGLTFRQLLYAFLFAPSIALVFFKTHWHLLLKIFLGTNLLALGIGFIFLDLERHIRNWYSWYRSKKIEKLEKMAKFIPIEAIRDNLIHTRDKRKLAVLRITPLNFSIRPEDSKNALTIGFQRFLNSIDFPVQILMNTENLDLKDYFAQVEKRLLKTEQFERLFEGYKKHLETITRSQNVMNRNFYVIIPEMTDLSIQIQICQNKLGNLGLKSYRMRDGELKELAKRFFESNKEFYPKRIENYPSYIKIVRDEEIKEPKGKKKPEIVKQDAILSRTIYAHGYPRSVEAGFLDKIVSLPGNFDFSIHIEPYDIETMMVFLNKELQKQSADLYASKLKNILNPSLEIKYRDTKSVLENLQKGKDKLFNVSLYINCRAKTKEDLDLLTRRIEAELNSLLIIPKQPYFRMAQGFQSSSPLAINNLKQIRSLPTEALSAFFPFTSSFLQADKGGVWLGLNKNNIPIIKDIFALSNPNGLCLASSGSGKSYMAKLLISRYLLNGTKVMVIDPQGEYKALVKRFNGQLIDLSRVSDTIINPLDLMGHDYPEKRLALMDLMPLMLGDLSDPQKSFIDRALTIAYEQRGIYMNEVSTWKKKPPILGDVLEVLKNMRKTISLSEKQTLLSLIGRMDQYVNGVFSFLNQETSLNFDNQFVCFDIGELPKQVKPIIMFLVLDYIYMKMKKDLGRKLLVIDEAWSLLRQAHDASYIFEIVKTCRKFNLALFLINQEVEGMLDSDAGKSVLANSSYTLLMRQKPAVINNVKRTFFLSDSEVNHLLTSGVGEGVLIMEDEHSEIKIVASNEEHKTITTNADELLSAGLVETEEQRLERIQTQITKQIATRDKRPKVGINKESDCAKLVDLSENETDYLKKKGYKEYSFMGITSRKREKFLIRTRPKESAQHVFLINDIASYISKFTDKVWTYKSVQPDIIFEINGARYAIEVETGKILTSNKKAIVKKVRTLNETYPKRWFFIVTNRNTAAHYAEYGKTHDKRYVIHLIKSLVTESGK
jgi:type IV secretory pathway VirB4 component